MYQQEIRKWTLMAPSVGFGSTEDELCQDDLLGALICSMAVYDRNAEAEVLFRKAQELYPSIRFLKVHMSVDPSMKKHKRGQKFLVAYTADCVFIAFRGTKNLKDVASDLCTISERRFGGSFHKGFCDRADSFLGSGKWNPLPDLLDTARRERRRIIFSGHSLGGAVAHMVLLSCLLQIQIDTEQVTSEKCPDSMISIAFGAPHICDERIARLINEDPRFKWRFINFVNQKDPVPRMLHDLKKTTLAVLRGLLEEADTKLQCLEGFASLCLEGFEERGVRGALRVAAKETAHSTARSLVRAVKKVVSKTPNCSEEADPEDGTDDPKQPNFVSIGQYLCIKREGGHLVYTHYLCGSDRITEVFLEKAEYSQANVEHHLLKSYVGALLEVGFIGRSTRTGEPASRVDIPCSSLVTTPAPKVSTARWIAEEQESDQRFVAVQGENLLFLRAAVSITGSNGQEDWAIGKQSDKLLWIYDPKDYGRRQRDDENAISMVIIKTAFGEISHPIVHAEDYPSKERMLIGSQRMLKKIAESLMVIATPPLRIRPDSDAGVMDSLDDIMHCVSGLKEKVSTKLTQITKFTNTDRSDFLHHIMDINYMFKQVISCSNSCLKVEYKSSGLKNRLWRFGQKNPLLAIPAVVASGLVLPITLGAVLGVLLFYEKKTVIVGYEVVLQRAIDEASEWRTARGLHNSGASTSGRRNSSSSDDLENLLVQAVSESCSEFQDMVKKAHLMQPKDVKAFRSVFFLGATARSRIKLLKRIKVVCDSISLYTKVVLDTHFIGVFGEEDSGKSTFIKKVLKKFGTHRSNLLPAKGMDVHTKAAVSYRLNETLWLVDFPGSNGVNSYAGMWKQFTALSSSAILFLAFAGDVKREQVDMYKDLKDNLGAETKVTIVFNKVDLKFSPCNKAILTVDYFEKQRAKIRRKLECEENDGVHFSCVRPDPPESLEELRKVGVLGFEEIMRVVRPD